MLRRRRFGSQTMRSWPRASLAVLLLALGANVYSGAAQHNRSISCQDTSAELILTEERAIPLRKSLPPRALRWFEGEAWLVDGTSGALKRVSASGLTIPIDPTGEYELLGVGYGRMLAVRNDMVWVAGAGGGRPTPLGLRANRTITGIVSSGGAVWIAVADTNDASVLRIARARQAGGFAMRREIDVRGPVHLHQLTQGRVIASMIGYPYRVVVLDSTGMAVRRVSPDHALTWNRPAGLAGSVFALAALPLDCGRILHFLTDLRSDRRWIVLYGRSGAVLRTREFRQPLGLVQSLYPDERILVGFRDSPERGEIVLYRWRWEKPTEPPQGDRS